MSRMRGLHSAHATTLLAGVLALALASAPPCAAETAEPGVPRATDPGLEAEERVQAEEKGKQKEESDTETDDWTHFEMPAYPGLRPQDAVRLHVQSGFAPSADVGAAEVTLYQPELRGRLTLPLGGATVLRLAVSGGMSRYRFRGEDAFRYDGASLLGDTLKAYRTRMNLQGAYRLNEPGTSSLLFAGEAWSVLAGLEVGSDFEGGAFAEGLVGRGGMALGYELDGRVRAALGFALKTSAEDGGLEVAPVGSLRWDVTEHLTLRDRGLGVQIEYRVSPRLELFASGFRSSDTYRLRDVGDLEELTLRDRQVLALAGFEWRATRYLRVYAEAGAIAWRKMRVHADDLGTLVSQRGDPSPFVELRFEVRP